MGFRNSHQIQWFFYFLFTLTGRKWFLTWSMRFPLTILFLITVFDAFSQGVFTDSIACQKNRSELYALYIPKKYDARLAIPILIFFDPGGRANVPVKLYTSLADRYNVIIACGYGAKNGPTDPSVRAGYAIYEDVASRYNITKSAIFLSGFSGGARVATHIAMRDTAFHGVIACGATFPQNQKISSGRALPYAMVTGSKDMNFREAIESEQYLDGIDNPNVRFEFDGGHTWPPVAVFEQALKWLLIRNEIFSTIETEQFYKEDRRTALQLLTLDDKFELALFLKRMKSQYAFADAKHFSDSLLNAIKQSKQYLDQKKNLDDLLKKESGIANQFFDLFHKRVNTLRPDTAFQQSEWTAFQRIFTKLKNADEEQKRNTGERLINLTTIVCAEQSRMNLDYNDHDKALLCAKIWTAIDPKSPWGYFTIARIYGIKKDAKASLANLEKAFENGFNEKSRILNDPAFDILKNDRKFDQLLNSL
jgi:hypothetical protein